MRHLYETALQFVFAHFGSENVLFSNGFARIKKDDLVRLHFYSEEFSSLRNLRDKGKNCCFVVIEHQNVVDLVAQFVKKLSLNVLLLLISQIVNGSFKLVATARGVSFDEV